MASRQSLKLASGVRFVHSQPLPVRLVAGRLALNQAAVVRFHHRQPFSRGYRSIGKDRSLRTIRLGFDSSYPYHFRPVAQLDRAHPSEGCDLSSNLSGPTIFSGRREPQGPVMQQAVRLIHARPRFTRWRPTGEALRCLRSTCGFNSRPARQVCRGARVVECPASQAGDSGIVTRPRRHGVIGKMD